MNEDNELAIYHTVAMNAVRLLPADWEVKCLPHQGDDPHCRLGQYYYRSGIKARQIWLTGETEIMFKRVEIPCPESDLCLFIALHEVAHVVLGHTGVNSEERGEYEEAASKWAMAYMKENGVPVRPEVALTAELLWKVRYAMDRRDRPTFDALLGELGLSENDSMVNWWNDPSAVTVRGAAPA